MIKIYSKKIIPFLILAFGLLTNCGKEEEVLLHFNSVNIGVYMDDAVWPALKAPTLNILNQLNFPYSLLINDSIINNKLDQYSVLLLPGGSGGNYYENLGPEGFNNIKNYVRKGGGYIGICGSAYMACVTEIFRGWAGEPRRHGEYEGLGLFNGKSDGPLEDFLPGYRDINCKVEIVNDSHPVTRNLADTISYLYDHGPEFIANDNKSIAIGKSVKGNHLLISITEYGNGRVFLSSGHPEYTNSEECRILLKNAIEWCSKQE
ncbi:MAG: ThuA domain-containing protein [Bacteroidales bacterium]|nr:ThuA domain-containing protein [Bacteroidales bacterium]